MDVTLPLAVSLKWVAHACRTAGAAKPRWSREDATWTTTARTETGDRETIRISTRGSIVRVESSVEDSITVHRIVTGLVTGMQWAMRQQRAA